MQIEIRCAVEKMAHLIESSGDLYLIDITFVISLEHKVRRRAEEALQRNIKYKLILVIHPFNTAIKE